LFNVFNSRFEVQPDATIVNTVYHLTTISIFALASSLSIQVEAEGTDSLTDSSLAAKKKKHAAVKVTTRLQSLGIFNYGGLIANDNPVADINFTYDRKAWGVMIFKAFDLYKSQSEYNFTLAAAYKIFHVSKQLTITPYVGAVLEQQRRIADPGSDGIVILVSAFKLNPHLTLEHCARFSNTMVETQNFDWLNRLRLLYSKNHIDVTASAWRDNKVFDQSAYTTVGLTAAYSRIAVTDHLKLGTSVTGLWVASMSDESEKRNGIVFTIAATMN
jgi:hypothetical protein